LPGEFFNPKTEPLLIVISGLSGSGKDTVIQRIRERNLPFHFVVTATDRQPRPKEVDGVDYIFVSRERFEQMIQQDEFLEYARVYDQYKGIPREQVRQALASGKDVILRIDVQGASTIRDLCPEALLVFLSVENEQELIQRLRSRGSETRENLEIRRAAIQDEIKKMKIFDYVIVNRNGCLEETVDKISAIITAEHHRTQPRKVNL
jgi:guanylate kinase